VRSHHARHRHKVQVQQQQYAVVLQALVHEALARRHCEHLMQRRIAAITIQRFWRSSKTLDSSKLVAAVRLQAFGRGLLARIQFFVDKLDVICVQSCVRRWQTRQMLVRWMIASTTMQCFVRRLRARQTLAAKRLSLLRNVSAWRIQMLARQHLARNLLGVKRAQRQASVRVQSAWRRHQASALFARMVIAKANFMAAMRIQLAWRRFVALTLLRRLQTNRTRNCAAIVIQAVARRHQAKWQLVHLQWHVERKRAATVMQALWRGIRAREVLTQMWMASILIQSVVRRVAPMRRLLAVRRAVRQIQSHWRRFLAVSSFQSTLVHVCRSQSIVRRYLANAECRKRRQAVLLLQCGVRLFLLQKQVDKVFRLAQAKRTAELAASIRVQSLFRGWVVRTEIDNLVTRVKIISRTFRGYKARVICGWRRQNVVICQRAARRWFARRVARRRIALIQILQCAARSHLARAELRVRRRARRRAVIEFYASASIQRTFRGFLGRRALMMHFAARKVQTMWRCHKAHSDFILDVYAVIAIQAWTRRWISQSEHQRRLSAISRIHCFAKFALRQIHVERCWRSSLVIQSSYRMHVCRRAFLRHQLDERCAIAIQALVRMTLVRARLLETLTAVCVLQRYTRGFVVRLHLELDAFAASEIQRMFRGFVAREFLAWNILAVITLQTFFRKWAAQHWASQQRKESTALRHLRDRCALKIQREYRSHLLYIKRNSAARVVQNVVRKYQSRKTFCNLRTNTIRVQSMFRGNYIRRKSSDNLVEARARIVEANAIARKHPLMKLGNRTRVALARLAESSSLSEIMDSAIVLEMATRLSEVCCVSFAEAGAPAILFNLLRTCNRSLPHIKLVHVVLLTMSNVARYEHLLRSLATVSGAEIFLDLVQMFRDKEFVFGLVVALLELIVRTSPVVEVSRLEFGSADYSTRETSSSTFPFSVQRLCASREHLKRLKAVHDLCVRKLKFAGSDVIANRRSCMEVPSHLARGGAAPHPLAVQRFEAPNVREAVQQLERVIHRVERSRL
jgi:abnormal spindle-like microcephaly-associated protein